MGSGIVTVGRRPYAVGLYWENSPSGRVAQTAKEAASQPGQQADFYAVRGGTKDGRVPQFGLGQASSGHKAGMPAFAACLANQQPGSWAGAFRMREGTVITVVRDDLIVPDGDQFFLNETDARDRLLQEVGFGGLQRVYAPESWAIAGADTMPVSLLLDERRDVRLRPVEIPKMALLLGGAGVVVLLLLLGGGWYYQDMKEREEAERLAQLAAAERARQEAINLLPEALQPQKPQYPPPVRTWEERPPVMAIIEACREGLKQIVVATAGWRMNHLTCTGENIMTDWSRNIGFTDIPNHFMINDSGSSAVYNVALPKLTPRGPEELQNQNVITQRYLTQNWPGTIARTADDPPPPPPPGYQGTWSPPPHPGLSVPLLLQRQNCLRA